MDSIYVYQYFLSRILCLGSDFIETYTSFILLKQRYKLGTLVCSFSSSFLIIRWLLLQTVKYLGSFLVFVFLYTKLLMIMSLVTIIRLQAAHWIASFLFEHTVLRKRRSQFTIAIIYSIVYIVLLLQIQSPLVGYWLNDIYCINDITFLLVTKGI